MTEAVKRVVGNYRIVRALGAGGMGAVYEGVDLMLERPVAIKMLHPEIARQPELIERFRVEAVTLAKLNHPSIATLYSFFREGDQYYMVMEFVRGQTLEAVLRETPRLAPDCAAETLRQVLDGMTHAHAMGVLHRDIKPANIIVSGPAGGRPTVVKVTDFGIARILGSSRMTREGRLIGTLEYIAPERIRGEEADVRSDLYSAGVVLYEALAGRLPFVSQTDYDLMQAHVQQEPPQLRQLGLTCSEELEAIVRKSLAKSPAERFQSAQEFRNALTPFTQYGSAGAPRAPTRLAAMPPETRLAVQPTVAGERRFGRLPRRWVAAGAGLLLAAVMLIAWARLGRKPSMPGDTAVPTAIAAVNPVAPRQAEPEPQPAPVETALPRQFPLEPAGPGPESKPATSATPSPGLTSVPAPPAAVPASPQTIGGVRKLYIESLPNQLHVYLAQEIRKQMPERLRVVVDRADADAVLTGRSVKHGGSRFTAGFRDDYSGSVSITTTDGDSLLWESEAGDRSVMGIKHGGPKKVAERLVTSLRKAMLPPHGVAPSR